MASSGNHRNDYKTPPAFTSTKPYNRWVDEVKVWQTVTELSKAKQGSAIALSLPEDVGSVRDKVFSELGVDKLNKDDGVNALITFLDKIYKKDNLSEAYEAYTSFDRFKRNTDVLIEDYISEFEKLYNKTVKHNMTLPQAVLAFKVLDGAGLNHRDRQLTLTGVDYSKGDTLFTQMNASLKKFFGKQSLPAENDREKCDGIKLEPTFYNECEAFYTQNRWNQHSFRNNSRSRYQQPSKGRGFNRSTNHPRAYNNWTEKSHTSGGDGQKTRRPSNPLGPDGNPMKCRICQSIFHFARSCPDSYEALEKKVFENSSEAAVLFTGRAESEKQVLVTESINSAVLDSACSSTVTGRQWMACYLDSLDESHSDKVLRSKSEAYFKFGAGDKLKSIEKVTFPCELGGKRCMLTTDVVDSDIPLLLGKPDMKAAKVVLDLENDQAVINGSKVDLDCTSSGHYCVPIQINNTSIDQSTVFYTLKDKSPSEQKKIIIKLHKQFAHPSGQRLKLLLHDAGVKECDTIIDTVRAECEVCRKFSSTKPRPIVCLPIATNFNDVVAMDLKIFRDGLYFLHIIDLATRFSLAAVIRNKKPSTIVNKFMLLWIGSGFGIPKKILTDNGGEFANDELRDVAGNLNIEVCTSAAYSPWQNGICERNHAVVDDCVEKILADHPNLDIELALVWAIHAKNCLHMVYGYSPFQLVFGSNPNLPAVLHDKPPALEGKTYSEIFANHINALIAGRKAFIQAESSERIRRALRRQIRSSGESFQTGDAVYYRRDNQWKGPGKVLGKDGKVVFIRHGSICVRVSPCQLIRVEDEFITDNDFQNSSENDVDQVNDTSDHQMDTLEDTPENTDNSQMDINDNNTNDTTGLNLPKVHDKIKYLPSGNGTEWIEGEILSRAGKVTGRNRFWLNFQSKSDSKVQAIDFANDVKAWKSLNVIETDSSLPKEDGENKNTDDVEEVNSVFIPVQRHQEHRVKTAKLKELENWTSFKVYETVPDRGQPFITTRWVITEKTSPENIQIAKARLVARGFEETYNIQCDSPTAAKETLRIFLALSSTLSWKCQTIDIKAAFLQGDEIQRDIFLKPPPEANVDNVLWKLKKCVYGLNDASRIWYFSVRRKLIELSCKQSDIDPSLFYYHNNNKLIGMFLMHVDDFLWSGSDNFEKAVIDNVRSKFKIGKQAEGAFKYIGLKLTQSDNDIILDQVSYIENISQVPMNQNRASHKFENLTATEITQLRSMIGQINWVANQSRPDVCFDNLELSTSIKEPKVEDLLLANKIVKKLKSESCYVRFPNLGSINDLQLVLFCDASYANLKDGTSSAGGYVIFLVGNNSNCCPLAWKSCKIRRVVKSSLAAETLSLVEGLDTVIYLKHILSEILYQGDNTHIPITAYTDNKSLYENIHSTKQVFEKRLRIDIASIKQMIETGEVYQILWVDTSHQISDALTKHGASSHKLIEIFCNGHSDVLCND